MGASKLLYDMAVTVFCKVVGMGRVESWLKRSLTVQPSHVYTYGFPSSGTLNILGLLRIASHDRRTLFGTYNAIEGCSYFAFQSRSNFVVCVFQRCTCVYKLNALHATPTSFSGWSLVLQSKFDVFDKPEHTPILLSIEQRKAVTHMEACAKYQNCN